MNAHSDDIEAEHAAVARLLPWALSGTLAAAEQEQLERHLLLCASCRADLAWQQEFRQGVASAPTPPLPELESALSRLRPRLQPRPARPPWWQALARHWRQWSPWLAGAQGLALLALAALLLRPAAPLDYRALGTTEVKTGDLLVQFRPDTPEREIRRILLANGARIGAGPTAAEGWIVLVDEGQRQAVLARLRREPAVQLAASLHAEPAQ